MMQESRRQKSTSNHKTHFHEETSDISNNGQPFQRQNMRNVKARSKQREPNSYKVVNVDDVSRQGYRLTTDDRNRVVGSRKIGQRSISLGRDRSVGIRRGDNTKENDYRLMSVEDVSRNGHKLVTEDSGRVKKLKVNNDNRMRREDGDAVDGKWGTTTFEINDEDSQWRENVEPGHWVVDSVREQDQDNHGYFLEQHAKEKIAPGHWIVNSVDEQEERAENGHWVVDSVKEQNEKNKLEPGRWMVDSVKVQEEREENGRWVVDSVSEQNLRDKIEPGHWVVNSVKEQDADKQFDQARWVVDSVKEQGERQKITAARWEVTSAHTVEGRDSRQWGTESVMTNRDERIVVNGEGQWDIKSINTAPSSRATSVMMEESWEEYNNILQSPTPVPPPPPPVVNVASQRSKISTQVVQPVPPPPPSTFQVNYTQLPATSSIQVDTHVQKKPRPAEPDGIHVATVIQPRAPSVASTCSVFMEDSWTEIHTVPISSTSTEKYTMATEVQQGPHIASANMPLADHYSYRYAPQTQLSSFNQQEQHSMIRPQVSIPQTEALHQSIDVAHHDEELFGRPVRLCDAAGSPVRRLENTVSLSSVTERVCVELGPHSAIVDIVITVEMLHNGGTSGPLATQPWRRKELTLTRTVRLDLTKIRDSDQLKELMKRCQMKDQVTWTSNGQRSPEQVHHFEHNNRLGGQETLDLFCRLMHVTRDEEKRSGAAVMAADNVYLARDPGGHVTGVACEPRYLLAGLQSDPNSVVAKGESPRCLLY